MNEYQITQWKDPHSQSPSIFPKNTCDLDGKGIAVIIASLGETFPNMKIVFGTFTPVLMDILPL